MIPKLTCTLLMILLLWTGCKTKSKAETESTTQNTEAYQGNTPPVIQTESYSNQPDEEPAYYNNGVYCATVRYTNPSTQAESLYMLNVEVEEGKLVKINWPNGGWLDATHFTPPHVSENGFTTFKSDKGYEYDVLLKSVGGCDYTYGPGSLPDNSNSANSYTTNSYSTYGEEEDEEAKLENEYGRFKAEVVKRISGCDYMILENNGDYYVVEWMGRYDPNEGDVIQGNLHSYGTKTFWVHRRDRETRLYVEDYSITLSRAWEIIREKCNLEEEEEQ